MVVWATGRAGLTTQDPPSPFFKNADAQEREMTLYRFGESETSSSGIKQNGALVRISLVGRFLFVLLTKKRRECYLDESSCSYNLWPLNRLHVIRTGESRMDHFYLISFRYCLYVWVGGFEMHWINFAFLFFFFSFGGSDWMTSDGPALTFLFVPGTEPVTWSWLDRKDAAERYPSADV